MPDFVSAEPGYSAWDALRDPANSPLPDPLEGLVVKDEHLERVLRGIDFLVQDGAIGTQLQAHGLAQGGQNPDLECLAHPGAVTQVHREYVEAGSEMVTTNSFSANELKLAGAASVEEVCGTAVDCAKASGARYVTGSIGPLGKMLQPFGEVPIDEAYRMFFQQAKALAEAGADALSIETMADLREAKTALLAARDACKLPIFASMTYMNTGRTLFGTPPAAVAATLSSLGANVVAVNCSLGPKEIEPIARELVRASRCPVAVRPNAGMPRLENGATVYDVTPEEFAEAMGEMLGFGVNVIGGCCGTNPDFIKRLAHVVAKQGEPAVRPYLSGLRVCSSQEQVLVQLDEGDSLDMVSVVKQADEDVLDDIHEGDADAVVDEIDDARDDADVVEICLADAGLEGEGERVLLREVVDALEETSPVPLCLRCDDARALDGALRDLAGKPLVGPVSGDMDTLGRIASVAKRHGCGLAIPAGAEDAEAARSLAVSLGIPGEDIVFGA